MAKITKEQREALLRQSSSIGHGGIHVSMKGFTSGRFRILPMGDAPTPGEIVERCWSNSLKKGTTSPRTFGQRDPLADLLDVERKGKDEKSRKQLEEVANISREYWVPVIDRSDPGDAKNPKIKILPLRPGAFAAIRDLILDPDVGSDITNATDGKDFVLKKVEENGQTRYKVIFCDPSRLGKTGDKFDAAYEKAVLSAHAKFDLKSHIPTVDWNLIAELYKSVCGDDVPEEYLHQDSDLSGASEEAQSGEETATEAEQEGGNESGVVVGSNVSFDDGTGNTVQGTVTADVGIVDGDDCWCVVMEDGTEVHVVKDAVALVVEPEPEPAPAKMTATKIGKGSSPKTPAAEKTGGKKASAMANVRNMLAGKKR